MINAVRPDVDASRIKDVSRINDASWINRNGIAVSVVAHGIALAILAGIFHWPVKLVAYKLPGTKLGDQSLVYYSPGSAQMSSSDVAEKIVKKQKTVPVVHSAVAAPKPDDVAAANTERGDGSASQSGLGDGNITIALQKYFPYPKPNLSTLPKGSAGDVILNAVIDEHGKVSELTLLQGLGPAIDDEVIQTVNQWTYTPATKNGAPVASVQELHFHYQRNG